MTRTNLQDLAERIAALERREHPGRRLTSLAGGATWEDIVLKGKLAGTIVELLEAEEGMGAWTLALFMAGHALHAGKILVVADSESRFYPPAARRFLGDLKRTLVIRSKRGQAALTAMTQSLRCAAVGAVLGKLDRLRATDCRRLQVAAESGGGVGIVLRPIAALCMPSFAAIRLVVQNGSRINCSRIRQNPGELDSGYHATGWVEPRILANPATTWANPAKVRQLRVEVARFRGGHAGQSWTLEIDDEKGDVRLSAPVAAATSLAAPARASG